MINVSQFFNLILGNYRIDFQFFALVLTLTKHIQKYEIKKFVRIWSVLVSVLIFKKGYSGLNFSRTNTRFWAYSSLLSGMFCYRYYLLYTLVRTVIEVKFSLANK